MRKRELFSYNIDIVDWMTCQLVDSEFDAEMLHSEVEKLYSKAVDKYSGKDKDFEKFAEQFIAKHISLFKLSKGNSKFWSEDEVESNLVSEEDSEENNSELTI